MPGIAAPADVAVVGGGVIGLCLAESLASRGAGVALFDAGRFGAGASAGNAGWVTPALSNPLPAPGTIAMGLRWMLTKGPLRVRPVLRASYVSWLYEFARSCSPRKYAAGTAASLSLSRRALDDFDRLAARLPEFEMHESGMLLVSQRPAALDAQAKQFHQLQELGYTGRVQRLSQTEVHCAEPALHENVVGGILAHDERHLRPESLTAALVRRLKKLGVTLFEQTPVDAVGRAHADWVLSSGDAEFRARHLVIAGGAETVALTARLGLRLPVGRRAGGGRRLM